jgi:hypothetical protein
MVYKNSSGGDELLEPFRPRRMKNHSRQTVVTNVNERLHRLSRSCSSGLSWTRRWGSEEGDTTTQSSDAGTSDTTTKQQNEDADELEINEYMQNVVSVVHNDELFRRLKEDMRKSARSGFGSQHIVQKFVDEHAKEHNSSTTRKRSDSFGATMKNLRSASYESTDAENAIRHRSDGSVLSPTRGSTTTTSSNHSMKNIRPSQNKSSIDLMGRDSMMGQTFNKRQHHFQDHLVLQEAKSVVPGRQKQQQLLADFKTSFRNSTANLRSRIQTPPCA